MTVKQDLRVTSANLTDNQTILKDMSVPKNTTISLYHETIQFLVEMAKQTNDDGEYFPILGTALGFEQLVDI